MSLYKKIRSLGVEDDAHVTFSYEEGCDVMHYNETHIDTAMSETGFAYTLAEAVSEGILYRNGNSILEEMRTEGLLEEYERGDGTFVDFVAQVIEDNHFDFGWIEHSTEKYDHKRGYTTLSAEFDVPVSQLRREVHPLIGWQASVQTPNGYLTVER